MITIARYHDISCGHRVFGHENKCKHIHGHNYRITFHAHAAQLDQLGRVIDFSVIKSVLCQWLEDNWDHRLLVWEDDPLATTHVDGAVGDALRDSIVALPFNPTAENMADYLLQTVAPALLVDKPVFIYKIVVEETRKCSATAEDLDIDVME